MGFVKPSRYPMGYTTDGRCRLVCEQCEWISVPWSQQSDRNREESPASSVIARRPWKLGRSSLRTWQCLAPEKAVLRRARFKPV